MTTPRAPAVWSWAALGRSVKTFFGWIFGLGALVAVAVGVAARTAKAKKSRPVAKTFQKRNSAREQVDEHGHGAVALADETNPFADPGLPPHEPRIQDIDERAAKRSERVVAMLFTLSMLATVGFIASYVAIPRDKSIFVFPLGTSAR